MRLFEVKAGALVL